MSSAPRFYMHGLLGLGSLLKEKESRSAAASLCSSPKPDLLEKEIQARKLAIAGHAMDTRK